jgi:flagellin
MSDVVLTKSVRQNLLSLQNTTSLLDRTQERLATGKKVNSALDNPTNFFTAAGLDNRANDISNLLDGIANGVQVLKAADTGITSISKLVDSAKATARQALQSPNAFTSKANVTSASSLTNVKADNILGGTPAVQTAGASGIPSGATGLNAGTQSKTVIDLSAVKSTDTIRIQFNGYDSTAITAGSAVSDTVGASLVSALQGQFGSNVSYNSTSKELTVLGDFANDFTTTIGGPTPATTSTETASQDADTFTLQIGSGTALSFTKVTGTADTANGNFNTVADLADAINQSTANSSVLATVSGGKLNIQAKDAATSFTIGGTVNNGASAVTAANGLQFAAPGTAVTSTGGLNNTTLSLSIGTGIDLKSRSISLGTGANQVNTVDELNARINDIGLSASVDTAGKLKIETTNENAAKTFSVSGTAATAAGFAANSTSPVFGGPGDLQRQNLVKDFNNFLTQIDKLAQDASFNGTNLLQGDDLDLIFNETNTSSLKVKGVSFDSSGLGLTAAATTDFEDSSTINTFLNKLDSASSTLRSQAQKFGSNLSVVQTRQDFSKSLINVLQTGSSNLTLADTNEEAANVNALQTRQSLSVSALSLANQSNQAVLQLLR